MDERRMGIDEERVTVGEASNGLDRRVLLGGLAAGAAGLLLPRETAAGIKAIRFEVVNKEWSTVHLQFWYFKSGFPIGNWTKGEKTTLARGERKIWKSTQERDATRQRGFVAIDGRYGVQAFNKAVGYPEIECIRGEKPEGREEIKRDMDVGESLKWRVESDKLIEITRNPDSADFKEFTIVLKRETRDMVLREPDGGS